MKKKFILVQVHEIGNEAEVIIRDENGLLVYGGNLKKVENPKAYYPPTLSTSIHQAEQQHNQDCTREEWMEEKIKSALVEDRERVRGKIRKAPIWKLVPNTPRMIMCSDKELDDLLASLDKPLT